MTPNHIRALLGALIDRDAEAAQTAIDKGANPNAIVGGTRPLHIAVIAGSRPMIQLLFRHGAVPDSPDALGRTALHYAALGSANADPDLIDTLIAAGASVNVADAHGCTPLDLAAGAQNQAAAMALLRAGATCRADRVKWVQRVSGEDPASGSSDRSRSP